MKPQKTLLEIFDPPLCCPGGVCGPEVDPELVGIFETLMQLGSEYAEKIEVRRYIVPHDLSKVKGDDTFRQRLVHWQNQNWFPVTCVNGEVVKTQKYPLYEELVALTQVEATG